MSLSRSCRLYGISRQGIYQRVQRIEQRRHHLAPVQELVLDIRRRLPRLGGRKLYHLLKPRFAEQAIKLGRDGFFAWLRQNHLLVARKRRYTRTTDSKHWLRKYPNLYADQRLSRPEQVFVSDITYVESGEGVHYLSLVTDAYSRKVMGHVLSRDLRAVHMTEALQKAVANRISDKRLIHHSDRGIQYCSSEYQQVLQQHGIKPSMTNGYDCYQNALAERVNGILKGEFLDVPCRTFAELDTVIGQSIEAYNQMRPHLSLGMKTPEQVHNEKAGC